ncbi:HAD-IA family hydrolase [Paraburkholderia phenoliruptrix]|uniref:HAD-IA family hydrolase n=1 Tax=Paraburkholderia phenoliruptrix TaxID=252970 RepID=UPI002869D834|nr:HAD-IA family hydrolase [Paraburkholderia phenoliruptrix]WMY10961.1 HAD-IA family hydrolase [Paraburkholderia phenoliruptrix]
MVLAAPNARGCPPVDMHGTLLDSHAPTVRAYTEWAIRYDLDPAVVLREAQERRTIDSLHGLARPGVDVESDALALMQRERHDTDGIVEIPGAGALLRSLPKDRWAIVTSADRVLAQNRIAAAGLPMPDVLVTAEDVDQGKPSPDGYLLAARQLKVDVRSCIVFEDAPAGITAGLRAGAQVVAVASTHTNGKLGDQPYVNDLLGIMPSLQREEVVLAFAR